MIFDFDVNKLIEQYVPFGLRKAVNLAWLKVLLQPIENLKQFFLLFISVARLEVRLNGQVGVLENHLNDLYDAQERRIKIVDDSTRLFFKFDEAKNLPTVLSSVRPLYVPSSADNSIFDFVVKIPFLESQRAMLKSDVNAYYYPYYLYRYLPDSGIVADINRLVARYKIAGKTFNIESV